MEMLKTGIFKLNQINGLTGLEVPSEFYSVDLEDLPDLKELSLPKSLKFLTLKICPALTKIIKQQKLNNAPPAVRRQDYSMNATRSLTGACS